MMRNLLYLLPLLGFIFSCEQQAKTNNKDFDFEVFKITLPENWNKLELESYDSYAGAIETAKKDTVFFDYGISSYKMDHTIKVNDIKEYQKLDSIGFEMDRLYFSKHPFIDQNQGTFHKEYYYYDTISSYMSKISIPKVSGNGLTAVLFDSMENGNKLYLYANDINEEEQEILVKSFSTIRIK